MLEIEQRAGCGHIYIHRPGERNHDPPQCIAVGCGADQGWFVSQPLDERIGSGESPKGQAKGSGAVNDINSLYSHQMELFYWGLIMMGVCTGVLCMTLWVCVQHLAEAVAQNGTARDEAQCLVRTAMQRVKAFEDKFAVVTDEIRLRTERAVLLSRHWARVASAGWVYNGHYLDEATGD